MSDGPSSDVVAPKANGGSAEPFAFPRSPPTSLAVGKYKPNGWVFGALMGADLFVGAVCHRLIGLHPALCVLVMAVLPTVVAALVARALLRPKWQRNTRHEHGLVPEIIGQAKRFYGRHIRDPHTDFQLAFRDLAIEAKDERDGRPHALRAWYVPAKAGVGAGGGGANGERTCVVCVHGAGRDRRAFLRHTPALHAAGLSVVLMDCREHGTSDGRNRGIGYATREARDVAAVSAHCRAALGYARVFVLGTSQGAASAIVAAALYDRAVAGVIAENPFATRDDLMTHIVAAIFGQPPRLLAPLQAAYLRLIVALARLQLGVKTAADGSATPANPIDVVAALPCGLLLMHGTNDALIPYAHSQQLFEKAPEPKALWLAEQAEHTGLQNAYPDEFDRRVLQFIRATRTPAAVS